MPHGTYDMGLISIGIDGVFHDFAVDGQGTVLDAVGFIPSLKGFVEGIRVDPDQDITDDILAWHDEAAVFSAAVEAISGRLAETVGPIRDGTVTAHTTEDGRGRDGQDGFQGVAFALSTTGIRDLAKEHRQGFHFCSTKHFSSSCTIKGVEMGTGQEGFRVVSQRLEEDHLWR